MHLDELPGVRKDDAVVTMLNELAIEIHDNAARHGWWDEERSFGDVIALCHSELSEALEEYRSGHPMAYVYRDVYPGLKPDVITDVSEWGKTEKPEGIATEMIDCIIRILDWCGKEQIDVDALMKAKHEYNKTRPYRHGGKRL